VSIRGHMSCSKGRKQWISPPFRLSSEMAPACRLYIAISICAVASSVLLCSNKYISSFGRKCLAGGNPTSHNNHTA
jgi:hypothetical protein